MMLFDFHAAAIFDIVTDALPDAQPASPRRRRPRRRLRHIDLMLIAVCRLIRRRRFCAQPTTSSLATFTLCRSFRFATPRRFRCLLPFARAALHDAFFASSPFFDNSLSDNSFQRRFHFRR